MRSTVSLLGMYNADPDLFMGLKVPTGVDRDALIDLLLMDTAELEILYPSPSFLKLAIQRWASKELPVWEKLWETTVLEYNPIHNYDRWEDITDTRTPDLTYGKGTTDTSTTSGKDTTTGSQRAYNNTPMAEVDKQVFDHGSGVTTTHEGADTETGTDVNHHDAHIYGNIGVTTTMQMIREQREVVQFTVIDAIIDSFKRRFCLLIY